MMSCHKDKKNIVLADCEGEELTEFVRGLEDAIREKFTIRSSICNGSHSKLYNIKRYLVYALYPIKFVIHHNRYRYVIGWQQFFVLFFVFYCRLFHVSKNSTIVAMNFTYKEKKGIIGRIYKNFMKLCIDNPYLDYIHVPSWSYAEKCEKIFHVEKDKFIITPFGLPDTYEKWKNSTVEYKNYCLAIGRSNRDFDFLVRAWKQLPGNELLIIASDTYKPKEKLPENVIHRRDIEGDEQFPYIANCKIMIIPILDGSICSGDTVLLKAMSYEKIVVVTIPSTLAEMYIRDGENGILTPKNEKDFGEILKSILNNNKSHIGLNARKIYLELFSRNMMGKKIGEYIVWRKG